MTSGTGRVPRERIAGNCGAPRIAVALLLSITIAGCATRTQRANSPPPSDDPLVAYQTQVATGSCVYRIRPEAALGGLAGALLSSVITQGVNYFGSALAEAAKETNDTVTANRNVEISAERFGPCMQIVRGWFHRGFFRDAESTAAFDDAARTWAAAGNAGAVNVDQLTLLWQRRMWLAAQPDFVFEAEVVRTTVKTAPDSTLLTLTPAFARLDHPISSAVLRPSKARSIAVFFAFHKADEDPSAPGTATGGLTVGLLRPGVALTFPPPVRDTNDTPNRGNDESKWFSISLGNASQPMTISALVSEHQDASAFLQFVADVFGGAKPELTNALQTALVPSTRAAAREGERAAAEAATTAYESALVAALASATACADTVTDALATASDLRGKLRSFNQAARVLGRTQVSEAIVPLVLDASKVRDGCAAASAELHKVL
jgi:hypothetical protein